MKKQDLQRLNSSIRRSNRTEAAPPTSVADIREHWEADQSKLATKIAGLKDKVSAAFQQTCEVAKILNMAPRLGKAFKIAAPKMLKDLGAIHSQLIASKLQLENISK